MRSMFLMLSIVSLAAAVQAQEIMPTPVTVAGADAVVPRGGSCTATSVGLTALLQDLPLDLLGFPQISRSADPCAFRERSERYPDRRLMASRPAGPTKERKRDVHR